MNRTEKEWLETALTEISSAEVEQIPYDTLALLYPNVLMYGPNGEAVAEFVTDVMAKVQSCGDHDAYGSYATTVRAAMNENSNMPFFSMQDDANFRIGVNVESNLRILVNQWVNSSPSTPYIFESATFSLSSLIAYQGLLKDRKRWSSYEKSYSAVVESFGLNPDKYRWRKS